MELFVHTLEEAQRLGLGVDLANASGWPFGVLGLRKQAPARPFLPEPGL